MIKNLLVKKNIIIAALVLSIALASSGILLVANNGSIKDFGAASFLPAMGWAKKEIQSKEREIENLKNIVVSKEREIKKELDEIHILRTTLSSKDKEVDAKNTEIADLKNQIALKEQEVAGKAEEVKTLAANIGKKEKEVKAKESENSDLKNKLSLKDEEKSKEVSNWQEKVSEKEKQVLEKEKEVSEKEKESSGKDQEIETLKNKMTAKSVKNTNNPILKADTNSSKWDGQNHVAGNCAIKGPGGNTYLFYYANSTSGSSVGVALSGDNMNFSKHPTPVLRPGSSSEWDGGGVSVFPGCIVQKRDGTYLMYYSGIKYGAADFYWGSLGAIGVAFSTDLITWTKYQNNPILVSSWTVDWEREGVFEPSVIFTGDEYGGQGSYLMWYGGNNKDGIMSIGFATSPNGIDWIKYSNNPVLSRSSNSLDFDGYTIEVHHVLKVNDGYVMAYEATDRKFPSHFSIGWASSKDGITWKKSEDNPIIEAGAVGDWDSFGAYHPSLLIEDGGKIVMFYVGLNNKYDHGIGVAEINPYYFSKLQQ